VIVALPAPRAATVLADLDRELSRELSEIPYAGCVIVLVGYRRDQFTRPLSGFGFVVPDVEHRRIIACSYSSQKFTERAPSDSVLLRVFLGGAGHPEVELLGDDDLQQIARSEIEELLGAHGEPQLCQVRRWSGAMPQYHVGHLARVARIFERASRYAGLALAGNAYHGVGIPNCIHSGEQAAERLLNKPW
jgi:oxygen-dependent protoporphyrinogen oxidase